MTVKPLPVWLRHHVAEKFKRSASPHLGPFLLGAEDNEDFGKTEGQEDTEKKKKEAPLGISCTGTVYNWGWENDFIDLLRTNWHNLALEFER